MIPLFNYRKKRRRKPHFFHSGSHRRQYYRKKRRSDSRGVWRKRCLIVLAICMVLAGGGFGGFVFLRESGKSDLMNYAGSEQMELEGKKGSAGLVSRNGKKYQYNEEIITLLCMGIDQGTENWSEEAEQGENGQADAIFLLVLNQKNHEMDLIGISRDTMTEIATYDRQGNYVGESINHLALAFSYGKTKEEGAEMVLNAVSKLFYQLPIHGYAAIDWDALEKLNDAVGGVLVTVDEEMTLGGETYHSGDKIRLKGSQAQSFVRHRGEQLGSNNRRMQRQKAYASAFISEAKKEISRNPFLAADLYKDLTDDMVTSLGAKEAVYLMSLLPSVSFSLDQIQAIAGTVKQGSRYEEFYVDEDQLRNLILDVFYEEVEE
jgi:LCP family protein required for cell wall assembly